MNKFNIGILDVVNYSQPSQYRKKRGRGVVFFKNLAPPPSSGVRETTTLPLRLRGMRFCLSFVSLSIPESTVSSKFVLIVKY